MAETQYLTLKDLCKRLKLAQSTIFGLLRQGKFPRGLKIGHSRRWNFDEVTAWAKVQSLEQEAMN